MEDELMSSLHYTDSRTVLLDDVHSVTESY
jgi:hypothetical protein